MKLKFTETQETKSQKNNREKNDKKHRDFRWEETPEACVNLPTNKI